MYKHLPEKHQKNLKKIYAHIHPNRAMVLILSFAIIGVIILMISKAATSTASIEAENGTLSGNASKVSETNTSTGSAVKFNAQVITPPGGYPVWKVGTGTNAAKFVDGSGNVIQLRGVGVPGLEIGCSNQGTGVIMQAQNGAGTDINYYKTVAASLLTWDNANTQPKGPHAINVVRLPLNEECWLGINQAASGQTVANYAKVSGTIYQTFVKNLVTALRDEGIYVVLDLHIANDGSYFMDSPSQGGYVQPITANADHSLTFWDQVSGMMNASNGYPNVAYDLINEPGVGCNPGANQCPSNQSGWPLGELWAGRLYRDGGPYTLSANDGDAYSNRIGQTFQVAGTQQMLNTIRVHATNPILVETLGFGSGGLDTLAAYMPVDPLNQVGVSYHVYPGSGTDVSGGDYTTDNLTKGIDPNGNIGVEAYKILGHLPVFVGEYNENTCSNSATWINANNTYFNSHNFSYTAYAWTNSQGCNDILTDLPTGTTKYTGPFIKANLQTLQNKLTASAP